MRTALYIACFGLMIVACGPTSKQLEGRERHQRQSPSERITNGVSAFEYACLDTAPSFADGDTRIAERFESTAASGISNLNGLCLITMTSVSKTETEAAVTQMLSRRNIEWTPGNFEETSEIGSEIMVAGSSMILSVQIAKQSNGQGDPTTIILLTPNRR